ncbi:MAG: flagellar hook capping FlgD N-terminal domain-containing protein [Rhizomicrobium sp.]|jgi:flagellar basal-body rod modification protein FlgD
MGTSAINGSSGAAGTSANASQQLTGNLNTFLTLLTTQLQNQDPMNPMDSDQFTQQLVEYSQVEQQINTNTNLQTLISLQQGGAGSSAVGYLGKTVTVTNGNAALIDGATSWNYALAATSASTTLTVSNANGQAVYSTTGSTTAGSNAFSWNGQDNNGNQLPDGVYTLSVNATAINGSAVQTAVSSSGVVSEVNLSGSTPELMIGLMAVPLSQVAAVQDPTS